MTVIYKRNSNLRETKIQNNELGEYVPPIQLDFVNSQRILLEQRYDRRPDLLAYDLYGDGKFWWLFTLFNRNEILDPIHDFRSGMEIFVPSQDYVAGIK